jgi:DNA polymerase-1
VGGFTLRGAFVAMGGRVLLAADYSQIELRMLAHLAGDAKLIALLRRAGVGPKP